MKRLWQFFFSGRESAHQHLKEIQTKFGRFLALLECNNRILQCMSDMEEKAQGEYLFDRQYIFTNVSEIQSRVKDIIEHMIAIGGGDYSVLSARCDSINRRLESELYGCPGVEQCEYAIPFDRLDRDQVPKVGGKNAQLGEIKNKLNLPVPDGFAITTWAYKQFIDSNNLQSQIAEKIKSLNLKNLEDLERVSRGIQNLILHSPIPDNLAQALESQIRSLLQRRPNAKFALRSSAIGEDEHLSFAGQYNTLLNVQKNIAERYREILAGKFTSKAIYYCVSHSLEESMMPMSVGCLVMIDACAGGVIYTHDPIHTADDAILVHSIFGLGKYLVDGAVSPDVFRLDRSTGKVLSSQIAQKTHRLILHPEEGTMDQPLPDSLQTASSLTDDQLQTLWQYAKQLEDHYECPQDIEFVIDRQNQIYIVQSRLLRVISENPEVNEPDVRNWKPLFKGGDSVCPGAGVGATFHAASIRDLARVPQGAVLIAPQPFPGLITVMDRIHAIVTQTGGAASHMATLAREYRIPTVSGVSNASQLPSGATVTIDASKGVIYEGAHPELIEARKIETEIFKDAPIINLIRRVLNVLVPLHLKDPSSPDFTSDRCLSFHDITRFAHQKSMEEMFSSAKNLKNKEKIGLRLKSDIPLPLYIIFIDREWDPAKYKGKIARGDIHSQPMLAFWSGIEEEGWPAPPSGEGKFKGFMSVISTTMTAESEAEFGESSFAILGREYMIVSLFLGYHFTTIEAMSSPDVGKNYIRIQFKGGGSTSDRRIRRIQLIDRLLAQLGFETQQNGDFFLGQLTYQPADAILKKLRLLGRLTMITKQLDMALANDSILNWYADDFKKKMRL